MPYSVPNAKPTSSWVKPRAIRRCLKNLAKASISIAEVDPGVGRLFSNLGDVVMMGVRTTGCVFGGFCVKTPFDVVIEGLWSIVCG